MAFPTGWGRKCKLTIQSGKVAATQTNFPVLLDLTNLPSEMFDADGSYPALNGGGDIRFSSDAAGTTQLACEIVVFTTDNDPANGVAEIWVNVPSVSSSTNTDIYVWYNKAAETQPAEDAAYGKEATWNSDYKLVQHMQQDPSGSAPQMIDSTSNDDDGTSLGTMTSGDVVAGQVYNGLDFDGSDDGIELSNNLSSGTMSISAWVEGTAQGNYNIVVGAWDADTGASDQTFILYADTSSSGKFWFTMRESDDSQINIQSSTALTDGNMHQIVAVADGAGSIRFYTDGTADATPVAYDNTMNPATRPTRIGIFDNDTLPFTGVIDEVNVRYNALSANDVLTHYNNESDPATFVVEGTPENPAGSAPASAPVQPPQVITWM